MSAAVASTIGFGLLLAVSPWAIVIVLVLLEASRGLAVAWSFVLGWAGGIAVVGGAVVFGLGALAAGTETQGRVTLVFELVLGVVLLGYGVFRLVPSRAGSVERSEPLEPSTPRWLGALEELRPLYALAFGAFWVNYPVALLWGGEVLQTSLGAAAYGVLLGAFVALGSSGIGGIAAYATFAPERSTPVVVRLRAWLVRNTAVLVTTLALVVGAVLLAQGVVGLA